VFLLANRFGSAVEAFPKAGQSFPHGSDIVLPCRPFLDLMQNIFAEAFSDELGEFGFVALECRSAAPKTRDESRKFIAVKQ
jgi:hypothetical protein